MANNIPYIKIDNADTYVGWKAKPLAYDEPAATGAKDGGGINNPSFVGLIDTNSKVWNAPTGTIELQFEGTTELAVRDLQSKFITDMKIKASFVKLENGGRPGWFRYAKFLDTSQWRIWKDVSGTYVGRYTYNLIFKDPFLYELAFTVVEKAKTAFQAVSNYIFGWMQVTPEMFGSREFEFEWTIEETNTDYPRIGSTGTTFMQYVNQSSGYPNIAASANIYQIILQSASAGTFSSAAKTTCKYSASNLSTGALTPSITPGGLRYFTKGHLYELNRLTSSGSIVLGFAYTEDSMTTADAAYRNAYYSCRLRYRRMKLE